MALVIYSRDIHKFVKRCGLLSGINLIPLFLGGQMNPIVNHSGVGLRLYARIHRWLGRIAIVEGIIHMTVAWPTNKSKFTVLPDISGLAVSDS